MGPRGGRIRAGVAVLALVVVAVAAPAQARSARERLAPGQVLLRLTTGRATPMAGSPVRVYLMPFEHGAKYEPPLLARGVTDAHGDLVATLDLGPVHEMFADVGGSGRFNALVVAADPAGGWSLFRFVVLSASRPSVVRARAMARPRSIPTFGSLSTEDLLDIGVVREVGTRRGPSGLNDAQPQIGEPVTRWPDVGTLSSAPGITTSFVYSGNGSRETLTQIAVAACPSCTFQAGGFQLESEGRGFSAGPAVRSDQWYNYHWEARYEFRKYCYIARFTCLQTWWEPHHFEGGVRHAEAASRPPFDGEHSQRLNLTYSRSTVQAKTYGSSFSLAGVGLDSIASYAAHTWMRWDPIGDPSCGGGRDSRIYGNGVDWPSAPIVWTTCV